MSRAFNLYRLQQVDTQLDRTLARLAEIEKCLGEDENVRKSKVAFETAENDRSAIHKSLTLAEDTTRSHRLKIEQTENHLYSGRVTNPKELQDLQNEVAALKRYLDTLEERQLEAILELDDADTALTEARQALDDVQATKLQDDAALNGEKTELTNKVNKLQTERTVAMVSVRAEDRETYERLRKKHSGVAVSAASGQSCSACGSSLHAALYQSARMSDQLAYCETCKRILYAG